MQLYNVMAHTEIVINLPKVIHEKHQTGKGETLLRCMINKLSKSSPAKNDSRGYEMSMWPAQRESQSFKAMDHEALTAELSHLVWTL